MSISLSVFFSLHNSLPHAPCLPLLQKSERYPGSVMGCEVKGEEGLAGCVYLCEERQEGAWEGKVMFVDKDR